MFEQPTSWLLSDESAVLRSGALFAEAFNVCRATQQRAQRPRSRASVRSLGVESPYTTSVWAAGARLLVRLSRDYSTLVSLFCQRDGRAAGPPSPPHRHSADGPDKQASQYVPYTCTAVAFGATVTVYNNTFKRDTHGDKITATVTAATMICNVKHCDPRSVTYKPV